MSPAPAAVAGRSARCLFFSVRRGLVPLVLGIAGFPVSKLTLVVGELRLVVVLEELHRIFMHLRGLVVDRRRVLVRGRSPDAVPLAFFIGISHNASISFTAAAVSLACGERLPTANGPQRVCVRTARRAE